MVDFLFFPRPGQGHWRIKRENEKQQHEIAYGGSKKEKLKQGGW